MSEAHQSPSPVEEKVLSSFRNAYTAAAGFVEDRGAADDLVAELRPVLDALLAGLGATGGENVGALEHREALAMITLFGRRVGSLGITPSSSFAALDSFLVALRTHDVAITDGMRRSLSALFFEGFIAAREERIVNKERIVAAESQPVLTLAKGCMALVLSGTHEAESLAAIIDRFARAVLRANANTCLIDITHLDAASGVAAEVFSADASVRMLGATCIFSGVTPHWREAGVKSRVSFELLRTVPTFEEGMREALSAAGYMLRAEPGFVRWLRGNAGRGRR